MKKIILLILALFVVISSCKKDDDKTDHEPSESEIIESNIQAVLDSIIENTHVPGLVAGVWAPNEGVDFVYSAGVANLETEEPMSDEMVYRIVSIRMLANMTSGINCFMELDAFWEEAFANPDKQWTYDEQIALVEDLPFHFSSGTNFHYCNTNTVLIGKIIELVTGESMEYNVHNRIIDPLQMNNTKYMSAGKDIPGYHSKAYYGGEVTSDLPELSEYLDISWAGPAGCMISDIYDLKKYVQALAKGELYSTELHQQQIICTDMNIGRPLMYGLGIYESNGFYGHDGQLPGYTSLMIHSPERNCTIVVWYNGQLDNS